MGIGPVPAVRRLLERTGRHRRRARPARAERGLRLAVTRRRARARDRRGEGERQRRRDRDWASARHERRAPDRDAVARAAQARRALRCRHDVCRRRSGTGGIVRGAGRMTERYLLLALRLGRHVDGLVDSYYGPSRATATGRKPRARSTRPQLAADGDALLAELPDGWLSDQVKGCATYAHVLAGDDISVRRRGRGLLRRAPGARRYERLRSGARATRRAAARVTGRFSSAAQELARRSTSSKGALAVPVLNDLLPILREAARAFS